jgi:hypothetical protein
VVRNNCRGGPPWPPLCYRKEFSAGAATEVFIIMTCFTDRYHDILYR